jgi:type II secretory pathway component PulC
MMWILAAVVLLAPQEDDSKRARDAALGLPGLAQAVPVAPAPAAEPGPTATFMGARAKRQVEDYKALLDHNIFSPPRKKESNRDKTGEGSKPPEGPKTRTWVLTGIVFNAVDKRYEALIEDQGPGTRESKFCKAGDTIAGAVISEITAEKVSFTKDAAPGVLKLKDTLSETVTGASAAAPAPAKAEDEGEVEKARERMKKRHKREVVQDEAEEDAEKSKKPK